MNADIHARGFTLTSRLRATVAREAAVLHLRPPRRIGAIARAFARLQRGARTALDPTRTSHRSPPPRLGECAVPDMNRDAGFAVLPAQT